MSQPVIRGIQAAGAINIWYRYNGPEGKLPVPETIRLRDENGLIKFIDTSNKIALCGFLLDQDFLDANPQVASSIVYPVLGGGGVAITNNNRTGQLTFICTKVSTPRSKTAAMAPMGHITAGDANSPWDGIGVAPQIENAYDATLISQIQQAQRGGGDSYGATIIVEFMFCGCKTSIEFQACTVGTVKPLTASGIKPGTYPIAWNYLNWIPSYYTEKATISQAADVNYATEALNKNWTE